MNDAGARSGVTGSRCPQCSGRVVIRLLAGEACEQCKSKDAWDHFGADGKVLVVDKRDIAQTERRSRREVGGGPKLAGRFRLLPAVISVGLVSLSAASAVRLLEPMPLGPLASVHRELLAAAMVTTGLGALCTFSGILALVHIRWSGQAHAWFLHSVNVLAALVGAVVFFLGQSNWTTAARGPRWAYQEMPGLSERATDSLIERAIMRATVVILAPDGDGDARRLAIGAGAIVGSDAEEALVATNSHVAMPYAAVASWRDVTKSHPVWVYLSDGRDVEGEVVWTADPPLDVALVKINIANPPPAIELAGESIGIGPGTRVQFVPNPFRAGWLIRGGIVEKRESHDTSAGKYSLIYTDVLVQPGDSGTGLFDIEGRLIGFNTWNRLEKKGPLGVSLPVTVMKQFQVMDCMDRTGP